ncbi:hypothetical protein [Streptomyces nondiastaticus]|uniref:Uncharacterized protein n=1 Tax=Streptomyces nondiastaticus TaxID=3154512 RepID=A0ABW6U689_9ACTN
MGSESERDALVLHTGEYDYVVRLPGANPFEASDVSHLAGRDQLQSRQRRNRSFGHTR